MKRLIINADDFGYSRAVNYGIIDAHTQGILTSTTLMTNMPGADHAYTLGKEYSDLGIGIHLTLTCGRPLLDNHYTLVDPDGNFKKLHHYQKLFHVDEEELYREWKAQIEAFLASGLRPSHLDSHHHVNTLPGILPTFIRLAKEYKLPARNNFEQENGSQIRTTDSFEYNPEVLLKSEKELEELYGDANTIEIMCHPAYLDKHIMEGSSYVMPRIEELYMLTHQDTTAKLRDGKVFELISFHQLNEGDEVS